MIYGKKKKMPLIVLFIICPLGYLDMMAFFQICITFSSMGERKTCGLLSLYVSSLSYFIKLADFISSPLSRSKETPKKFIEALYISFIPLSFLP